MRKVLILGCRPICNGGIENFLLNYMSGVDKEKYLFTIVCDSNDYSDDYNQKLDEIGVKIQYVKDFNRCGVLHRIKIYKNLDFDIAHIQVTCGQKCIDGMICKMLRKRVIYHSHSNLPIKPIKYRILCPFFRLTGDKFLAVSSESGVYFFGQEIIRDERFKVVLNGIDQNRFSFSEAKRAAFRKEIGVRDDTFVLLFVGRLSPEKNIKYAVDVFDCIVKKKKEAYFAIVGDGELREEISSLIISLGLSSKVVLLGNRNDVDAVMCGSDCLILPSLFESFGIVLVEAQSCSLPCFSSDVVPMSTCVSDFIEYFDIKESANMVAEKVLAKASFGQKRNSDNSFINSKGLSSHSLGSIMEKMLDLV